MPLSNFTRPFTPYENNPLPNDHKFRNITRIEKRPLTDEEVEDECNSSVDRDRELDQKIEDVQAGIITGSDDPLNAGKFVTTDGATEPTLSWVSVTNGNIEDGAISGLKITPLTIGTNQLDNGIIVPDKIPNESIPYAKMDFNAEDIPYAIINVPNGAILYEKITIPDGSITYSKLNIPDNTIPGSKLVNKSISQAQQGLLSIGTPELIDASVTLPKIAPNVLTPTAVKADQIAANATTVYTNPAVQQHHPSANKFSCNFDGILAGTNAPRFGYNVASVQRISTGFYQINFIVPFANADYIIKGSTKSVSTHFTFFNIETQNTNFCRIVVINPSQTLLDVGTVCLEGSGLQ